MPKLQEKSGSKKSQRPKKKAAPKKKVKAEEWVASYKRGMPKPLPREPKVPLSTDAKNVIKALNSESIHIDTIRKKTNLSAPALAAAINRLLANKFITRTKGNFFEPVIPFWRMDGRDFEKYAYDDISQNAETFELPIRGQGWDRLFTDPTGADITRGNYMEQTYRAILWKALTEGKPVPIQLREYYDLPEPAPI